jgi:hypothetical protein
MSKICGFIEGAEPDLPAQKCPVDNGKQRLCLSVHKDLDGARTHIPDDAHIVPGKVR